MKNVINDMSMYVYLLAFICGAVTLVLNLITYQSDKKAAAKNKLIFQGFFFLYIVFNFILFFGRNFSWEASAHFTILMAFDISYICVLLSYLHYLNQMAFDRQNKKLNIITKAACGIYLGVWFIIYISSLDSRGYITVPFAKYAAFSAEAVLLLASFTCTAITLYKRYKRHIFPYWNLSVPGIAMLAYFIYTFFYNADAIFRFIGPSTWFFYPFDGVLVIYLIVSITDIASMVLQARNDRIATDASKRAKLEEAVCAIGRDYQLTNREQEILMDMAEGKSNAEIADHYIISIHTVKRHINNINRKTECKNRRENADLINRYL